MGKGRGHARFKKKPKKPPPAARRPACCWHIRLELGLWWAGGGGPLGEGGARKGSPVLPLEMIAGIGIFIGIYLSCRGAHM